MTKVNAIGQTVDPPRFSSAGSMWKIGPLTRPGFLSQALGEDSSGGYLDSRIHEHRVATAPRFPNN